MSLENPHQARLFSQPNPHWLARGIRALAIEHRLPYRLSKALDKFCKHAGFAHKTIEEGGLKFIVRRSTCDEMFVQRIIVNRDYNPPGYEIEETDTVIDIGGNIGTFALRAARRASRGKVFTFEPNSRNYRLLLKNIALNNLVNILPTRVAVSGAKGRVKLLCTAEGGFHGLSPLDGRCYLSSELVDAVSLQDILDKHNIRRCDFLKLDCEGAEYDILEALPTPYFERIEKMVMEYHGNNRQDQDRVDALVARLENVGFHIEAYTKVGGFISGFIRATKRF